MSLADVRLAEARAAWEKKKHECVELLIPLRLWPRTMDRLSSGQLTVRAWAQEKCEVLETLVLDALAERGWYYDHRTGGITREAWESCQGLPETIRSATHE